MKIPVLPLVALGCFAWAVSSVLSSQPRRVVTEPPVMPPRTTFAQTIAATGLVEPSSETISVGTHRSGVVEKVFVKLGDEVRQGQPLLKLDTRDLDAELAVTQAQLAEAQAQVAVAEAERIQARRNLDYAEKLDDARAISAEERTQRETSLATVSARLEASQAAVRLAQARVEVTRTAIQRSIVNAPLDATVLQLKVRAGEFISASPASSPWMTLGQTHPLHLRADVDEHEAWRIQAQASAVAHVRGNPDLKANLEFVCFEPMVIPKKSLTGDATERVDTRVLQVIYRLQKPASAALFVGQQMDVFIVDASRKKINE
ncbi:efflux RND transporter periplasmic adaptor subunit [Prosthecobacter dejongeii]|uniref:Multidrug efflux pump subunit AcrA (Membrane-fusion protein) n=1 Tax=Prosthecobacter dejongeii TaxID=48465 RepID=A0A7W8DQM1_9BACT|nr:efflux RND transporter periplasmic adaptor subunit [Prosthecobacter dejongeii]MBB5038076.1 multidrug efflux pump subunit AcrA (membrane-fusion protein) [Prosthecobacter dejongeii]